MHKSILYKLGLKIKRKLAEWFKAISLKLIRSNGLIRSNRILSEKQVRARLVRRLIWVEEVLCSNHNNLKSI